MRIGDVAKALGTTTRTLRFYEEAGLITPRRSSRGTRIYSNSDLERIGAILMLARLGVPIQEMSRIASIRSGSRTGNESSRAVTKHLEKMKQTAEQRLEEYRKLLGDVEQAAMLVEQCFGCRKQPVLKNCDRCSVGAALPDSQVLTLVWDQR
jgi:DNA-binding transcriptional MerR regulator